MQSQNKRPSISKRDGGNGFKDATTDPTTIRNWWARYPTAIVGMPTGARAHNVFVLDIDVKAGKVGEDTLSQIVETFGPLPETIEAIHGQWRTTSVFQASARRRDPEQGRSPRPGPRDLGPGGIPRCPVPDPPMASSSRLTSTSRAMAAM
ncbi:MAG: bifunctional DNA primase/polymerase [Chromatiales bacterium]|nr:bifunctional DNA primase/polymerase [Chromatiales bacterium]